MKNKKNKKQIIEIFNNKISGDNITIKNKAEGITLISLIITIIVLLILAGISIATLTGDNGIISQATNAKEKTEIAGEKEIIEQAIIQAMGNNRYGDLIKSELEEQINKLANQNVEVYTLEGNYIIYFEKSKRVYSTDNKGNNIELSDLETFKLAKYMEEISIAYEEAKNISSENADIFEQIKKELNYEGVNYTIGSISMIISTEDGFDFTLLEDGTVLNGVFAYLNIADGTIELYEEGYKQNNGELIAYTGDYVITGTTTENVVNVMEEGTYNITIKDLNIDIRSSGNEQGAFNANRNRKKNNCYVNVTLKGENYLYSGGSASGLAFSGAIPNINGETTGSTLTIQGEGHLMVKGGAYAAGIGSGYGYSVTSGQVSNIIINSGNIVTEAGSNGCAIGGGLRANVNNIIINGGNIQAIASNRYAIGSSAEGTLDNLVINGGNIVATGGEYGGAIGGGAGSGKITINGGIINARATHRYSAIGHKCSEVEITGGTIIVNAPKFAGISTIATGNIKITGGSILANGTMAIGKVDESDNLTETIPTNGTNDLYLTQIQLKDVNEKIEINKITTGDNKNYGIKDTYTSEDGILYLYMPEGNRTINVEANGKEYQGNVITNQSNSLVILDKK